MLKTIATMSLATALAFVTAPAFSDQLQNNAVKSVWIEDVYDERRESDPYTVRECFMVREEGNAAGGALAGMIIGGLIGKGATGDDGGAAAGAIIGGLIGADKGAQNDGLLREKCTEVIRYKESVRTIYNYSIIRFVYQGKQYELTFIK